MALDDEFLSAPTYKEPVWSTAAVRIGLAILIVGTAFRINHWAYSELINLVAIGIIFMSYAMRYGLKNVKNALDHIKVLLVSSWSVMYLFNLLHLPYANYPKYAFMAALFAFWYWGGNRKRNGIFAIPKGSVFEKPIHLLRIIYILILIVGAILKMQHWPFATLALLIGFGLAFSWMVLLVLEAILRKPEEVSEPSDMEGPAFIETAKETTSGLSIVKTLLPLGLGLLMLGSLLWLQGWAHSKSLVAVGVVVVLVYLFLDQKKKPEKLD